MESANNRKTILLSVSVYNELVLKQYSHISSINNSMLYLQHKLPLPEIMSNKNPNGFSIEDKKSMPGFSLSKNCPRSLLKKWTLTSFCKSSSPLICIPTSFLTVLPAPSVPTRMLQWIFFSSRFPSRIIDAVTVTQSLLVSIDTHSWPISIFLSGDWLFPSELSGKHIWKPRVSSCLSSNEVSLYCEKCATETGLTTCSRSDDKQKKY